MCVFTKIANFSKPSSRGLTTGSKSSMDPVVKPRDDGLLKDSYGLNRRGLSTVFFLLIVSASSLLTAFGVYVYRNKQSQKIGIEKDLLLTQLSASNKEITSLQDNNRKLSHKVQSYEQRLASVSTQNTVLSEDLTTNSNKHNQLLRDHNALLQEKQKLFDQLQNLENEKIALIEQIRTIESESFVKDTLKEKAMLEIEVTKLKETLKEQEQKHQKVLQDAQGYYQEELQKMQSHSQTLSAQLQEKSNHAQKVAGLHKQLSERDKQISSLSQKIEQAQGVAQNLADKLAKSEKQIDLEKQQTLAVQKEYNILLNKLNEVRADRSKIEVELNKSLDDLQKAEQYRKELEQQLDQADQTLKMRLQELARTKTDLDGIIARTRSKVLGSTEPYAAPSSIVSGQAMTSPKPHFTHMIAKEQSQKIQGQVIEIDQRYNFVVINKGAESGISKNNVFSIFQDQQKIGEAVVIEVRPDISAANLRMLNPDNPVNIGDKALMLKKTRHPVV